MDTNHCTTEDCQNPLDALLLLIETTINWVLSHPIAGLILLVGFGFLLILSFYQWAFNKGKSSK